MLSMLRYMADTGDDRSILLLWNNRAEADIAFPNELTDLEHRLPNLQVVHVLSRDPKFEGERGRLDKDRLARLLEGRARDSAVFCVRSAAHDEIGKKRSFPDRVRT